MKNKFTVLAFVLVLIFTGQACYAQNSVTDTTVNRATVKSADMNAAWNTASATNISLNGTTATVNGTGATANGSVVTINRAGTYVVSGTLTNGQIVIAATKDDNVQLVLNGANITNLNGAPIYASSCDKLILTLADGTQNSVTDGGKNFVYADTASNEPNAAVFSKDDLTINGTGTLTINAGFNNGITTKDDLVIASGTFIINAANHGIRGNDSVTIVDGNFRITAGNDGIQTNNESDTSLGWMDISGGVFSITSANDGIQADTTLNISGGTFNIAAGGGAANVQNTTNTFANARNPFNTRTVAAQVTATSDSYKGIKAGGNLAISGGNFNIDSADDGVHSNANVLISGGSLTIATADDGVHADSDLIIRGGNINVTRSFEGLEGNNVYISGGNISVVSSEDGINAADGSGGMFGFGWGRPMGEPGGGNNTINISGGTIRVVSGSDGLDSNGSIVISGGTLITQAIPARDGDALDADGTVTMTGGTVIYSGTVNTGRNPGAGSTQSYIYARTDVTAGSEITVKQNGQTLINYTPDVNIRMLAFSSPEIQSGRTYEIYNGSRLLATATAGTGGGGGFGGRGGFDGGNMPGGGRGNMPQGGMPPGGMPGGRW